MFPREERRTKFGRSLHRDSISRKVKDLDKVSSISLESMRQIHNLLLVSPAVRQDHLSEVPIRREGPRDESDGRRVLGGITEGEGPEVLVEPERQEERRKVDLLAPVQRLDQWHLGRVEVDRLRLEEVVDVELKVLVHRDVEVGAHAPVVLDHHAAVAVLLAGEGLEVGVREGDVALGVPVGDLGVRKTRTPNALGRLVAEILERGVLGRLLAEDDLEHPSLAVVAHALHVVDMELNEL